MASKSENVYETDKLLHEYLFFHYGTPEQLMPYDFGPRFAADFARRCGEECLKVLKQQGKDEQQNLRALDLGCAVGRSSFEMARVCSEVIGIDFSHRFVEHATKLKTDGKIRFEITREGDLTQKLEINLDSYYSLKERSRCQFLQGDACNLPFEKLGQFDVVLMANLICRLHSPKECIADLSKLLKVGGVLVIVSPYTWLEQFTPKEKWLGGYKRTVKKDNGEEVEEEVSGFQSLKEILQPTFEFLDSKDMPFLIYETCRKFQFTVSHCTMWKRK
eukprot:TRINITY_DN2182_c0_g1_i1.p1 TRINITY_DN2182_c0_g1~~TRINITY_DN2182_c0_g1_i1.p1  ORF type:complete len:290 (-),score=100.37 TRINITY_DN2182_c0_g1_i1:114-938(-)